MENEMRQSLSSNSRLTLDMSDSIDSVQPGENHTHHAPGALDTGGAETVPHRAAKILRLPDVLNLIGVSRSWLYKQIGTGDFPSPISLGSRSVGWLEAEIEAWIQERISFTRANRPNTEGVRILSRESSEATR
jgi:prophage regulatory protein